MTQICPPGLVGGRERGEGQCDPTSGRWYQKWASRVEPSAACPNQAERADIPSAGKVLVRQEEKAGRRAGKGNQPHTSLGLLDRWEIPREGKEIGTQGWPLQGQGSSYLGSDPAQYKTDAIKKKVGMTHMLR